MAIDDYLTVVGGRSNPDQRGLAARAVLEELARGVELTPAQRAELTARYAAETDVGVAALLRRALNRVDARTVLDRDPGRRFDRGLSAEERANLESVVARVRLLIDDVDGAGAFDSRYRILRRLDSGGMGCVLQACRREDGEPVVIKVILPEHADESGFRARFEREGRILERLRHPHIVRFHERGRVGDRMYLVMEHVAGGDVAGLLARGAISPDRARAILVQTLEALEACHAAGVVHRDVKPANLFVDERAAGPWVKLGDFGLARDCAAPDGLTRADATLECPPYTAPEQHRDPASAGPPADLHAFGVTAYEVLSGGRLPVDSYPPLSSLDPRLSPRIDAVIERCLARRPADRWQSARELRRALETILGA